MCRVPCLAEGNLRLRRLLLACMIFCLSLLMFSSFGLALCCLFRCCSGVYYCDQGRLTEQCIATTCQDGFVLSNQNADITTVCQACPIGTSAVRNPYQCGSCSIPALDSCSVVFNPMGGCAGYTYDCTPSDNVIFVGVSITFIILSVVLLFSTIWLFRQNAALKHAAAQQLQPLRSPDDTSYSSM